MDGEFDCAKGVRNKVDAVPLGVSFNAVALRGGGKKGLDVNKTISLAQV